MINYDITYNKAAYKNLLKLFFNKINKKSICCKFENIIYAIHILLQ